MTAERKEKLRLGFLTAIDAPPQAFVGGLLVTNHLGRPLEFQCTSPVKPSRTQELLYGHTLRPFVLAELIGKTLLDKAGVKPNLVLVEQQLLLELREQSDIPLAWVLGKDDKSDTDDLSQGRSKLRTHPEYTADRDEIQEMLSALPDDVDLSEPFQRVSEALREAMSGGAAA